MIGVVAGSKHAIELAYVPNENKIYIVDLLDNVLLRLDPNNPGGATVVGGGLGYTAEYAQGMDYDELNGVMYWATTNRIDEYAQLRIIDLESGNSAKIDDFLSGQVAGFAVAGYSGGASDVPWLSTDFTTGTVAPGESQQIEVTFIKKDILTQPGDYTAELHFLVDDVTPITPLPITLHVTSPEG